MGMFDEIKYECVCPVCHHKVDQFQSKSADCLLETLEPNKVGNFYSPCTKCGCWLDFTKMKDGEYCRNVMGKNWEPLPQHRKKISI